jgi:hypothetical protein
MKSISKFSLALIGISALSAVSSRAERPLRQDESVANIGLFRTFGDSTGATPTSDSTLLFTTGAACPPPNSLTPILAPDGHQVTWGEWNDVDGRASVKCVRQGSHVVVHLSGLIPNGQYSAWIVAFKPPGFNTDPTLPNPPAANAVTAGPLGPQDGSENGFVADDDGEGQISGILPPGPMSLLHLVAFDGCLEDYAEFHVHIAYHLDGMTHGPVQGPPCSWAVQRIFIFKP